MLKTFLYLALIGLTFQSCKKDKNKPDPQKERNNALIELVPPVLVPNFKSVNGAIPAYYIGLPSKYDSTSKNYPILISLHGAGTFGNGGSELQNILVDGIPRVMQEGRFPASFTVDGQNFSFIILAPQLSRHPATVEIDELITFAKKNYRVDPKRVYLNGLSLGSTVLWEMVADNSSQVTAIVPISGIPKEADNAKAQKVALAKIPTWSFQNEDDNIVNSQGVKDFITRINSFQPAIPPRFTLFPANGQLHNAWSKATDANYKENNVNIYEWMLQFKKP